MKANCSVLMFTGVKPWSNIMGILDEKEGGDTELLTYAMTLVNKVSTVKGRPSDPTSKSRLKEKQAISIKISNKI